MAERDFTAADKLKAVERELRYRRRVYDRRVSEGQMTQAFADEQVAVFEAIWNDYAAEVTRDRLL